MTSPAEGRVAPRRGARQPTAGHTGKSFTRNATPRPPPSPARRTQARAAARVRVSPTEKCVAPRRGGRQPTMGRPGKSLACNAPCEALHEWLDGRGRGPHSPRGEQLPCWGGRRLPASSGKDLARVGQAALRRSPPDLFQPPKLSGEGPGLYWSEGPPRKTSGCCLLCLARTSPAEEWTPPWRGGRILLLLLCLALLADGWVGLLFPPFAAACCN